MKRTILVIVIVGLATPALAQDRLPLGTHVGSAVAIPGSKGPLPSTTKAAGAILS